MTLPPVFENFLLDKLKSEQKLSVKKWLTGPVRNRSTGRSTGDDFEIYRSGRENPNRFDLWLDQLAGFVLTILHFHLAQVV